MTHYFDSDPPSASTPRTVALDLPDMQLELMADAGVFSSRRIDPGTELLLRIAPAPPLRGELLDLGSGYGAVAVALALRAPSARVWAVDVNRRALELVRRNANALGLDRVVAASPDEVPENVEFDAIYSNPPVRIGKHALHALLTEWMARLAPDGRAYLVVKKSLGSDSLADWLTAEGYIPRRLRSKKGYRILEVSRA